MFDASLNNPSSVCLSMFFHITMILILPMFLPSPHQRAMYWWQLIVVYLKAGIKVDIYILYEHSFYQGLNENVSVHRLLACVLYCVFSGLGVQVQWSSSW